ncbi:MULTISPECIES: tRNA (guanine(46)-N(7))-methyltransferase TrmB [unclassified Sphingopyxis]|uniref:tRNA (guanine(46)-N(7))-methyltransferase TrmB n=1 Tax=unclassified Sphingopyxis TaxID=2614943 RepID=UPI000735E29D|nr:MULTISPECIES: tRNA (guanine(46)-N(7))-methyltransferase TrmB [unclassified Sphingopyxis]KTE33491.1 tRNA (guanine-N7)-methyltransferase [Sphingopyxis sp. HIX]KTE83710.1 tRNA (guanine-N7)-methyltransferase [Sphingopyxis sp. HXXIV]
MTAYKPGDPTTINRLYGRSKGKPLRAGQQDLVDTLLPQIAVPAEGEVTAARLFGEERPLHFEIGFGGGEHMAGRADMLPDHGFIGAEPFINGVAQALVHVAGDHGKSLPLGNVRIHHGDALEVLRRIPDGALAFAYLLHPDPWPKARHAKRRMMNDGPLDLIAAKLKPGGEFRFGTDHPVYLEHALMVMRRHRHQYEWLAKDAKDFLTRPAGWPETRYEAKARTLGHEVWYFRYRRR